MADERKQPSFWAEIKAMAREAIKDVRNKAHEVFFGQPEHMAEMGTPLNPTPQMTTQALGTVRGNYSQVLDTYAAQGAQADPGKDQDLGR